MYKEIIFFSLFASILTFGCAHITGKQEDVNKSLKNTTTGVSFALPAVSASGFSEYWYQGKAEISSYQVTQERYGEERPAEQVMVFVTEDFSKQKQVKLDNPAAAGTDRVPVLKLNTLRHFHTGIYDYAMMESVFTPVDAKASPYTLKTTCSIQDWCGHVFMQTNLDGNNYRMRTLSYFEAEGDTDQRVPAGLLEDELWVRLRLEPKALPQGEVSVFPSSMFTRLRHKPAAAQPATLATVSNGAESTLVLQYLNMDRMLSIRYESAFPYRILGWEEHDNGKLSSKGSLKAQRLSPYWQENGKQFDALRDSLKLTF
jgi:hypothetical protein